MLVPHKKSKPQFRKSFRGVTKHNLKLISQKKSLLQTSLVGKLHFHSHTHSAFTIVEVESTVEQILVTTIAIEIAKTRLFATPDIQHHPFCRRRRRSSCIFHQISRRKKRRWCATSIYCPCRRELNRVPGWVEWQFSTRNFLGYDFFFCLVEWVG